MIPFSNVLYFCGALAVNGAVDLYASLLSSSSDYCIYESQANRHHLQLHAERPRPKTKMVDKDVLKAKVAYLVPSYQTM